MSDLDDQLANLSPEKRALIERRLAAKQAQGASRRTISPRSGDSPVPLSFAQQRLWFLDQLEPGSSLYNISKALHLEGALDVETLRQSLLEIVRRHEALRTTFALEDGAPVQVIRAPCATLEVLDLCGLSPEERESEMPRLIQEEAYRGFDLIQGPLFRTSLLKLGETAHILLLTMHHIVSDGWSMGVLMRELGALYNAFSAGKSSPLPELRIQYADYALWQREWLQGEVLQRQISYWKEHLAGAPALLELPTDRPRPLVQSFRGAVTPLELTAELTQSLKALGQREGATPFMLLLAAFQILLSRYSGQEDVVVGTPIANRTRSEVEGLIGFFLNTLALRTDLSGDPSFVELLGRVREVALGAYAHQDLPFEKLVEELAPERSLSHSPIFQVMLVLQNARYTKLEMAGLGAEAIDGEHVPAKYDLNILFWESGGQMRGAVEYSTDLFEAATIKRLVGHLKTLLEGIVADPNQRLSKLPLLTEPERHQLLHDWNDTAADYPRERCVHELFEEQVQRTPDAIALVFEDQHLSYAQLNARANQLAHYLQAWGVGPEVLVGLYVERSIDMVVGVLGILKAGGAYVPVDPANPHERLAYLLADSQVSLVLTQESFAEQLPAQSSLVLCFDAESDRLQAQPTNNPTGAMDPDNLAYVMFTSGSTGQPKGVAVPHRAVTRLVCGANYCELGPDEVILQCAPLAFDASTFEIWASLLNGGRLVLFDGQTPSLEELGEAIQRYGVSTLWLTAGLFHAMVESRLEGLRGVRQLLAGGDVLSPAHVQQALEGLPGCRLINGYGPTENTTFTCCYGMDAGWEVGGRIPIGRPISNTQVYVLDAQMRPVPVGVVGELYAGGSGVARGYLKRAELTAERFVPDPFSVEAGSRLYRTGDQVRWRSDRQLEFVGRIDQQVKIRGFRIELGEIESVLLGHGAVRDAVVVAREDVVGEKRLVAYVVGRDGTVSASELREHLRAQLPEYMVPSAFAMLESLPLSANGKVDRKALPAPEAPSHEETYVAPRTPIEEGVAEIWCEVLHLDRVGVHEGFFDLGGHSLLATQVISRIRNTFQVELPLRALFESPTVAGLAECIEEARGAGAAVAPPLTRVSREGSLPLSFAQQRLWFLDQFEPGSCLYNMPMALHLVGALNVNALGQSLQEIVGRHEALRTTFRFEEGAPIQVIGEAGGALTVVDLTALTGSEQESEARRLVTEEARRPFDLQRGPLLRTALLQLGEEEHILLMTMHHIVSDGWSLGVLRRELETLYSAFSAHKPSPLTELPIQYEDYAVWQREWLQGETLQGQISYWKEHLAGAPTLLELPTDRPRPPVQTFRGAAKRAELCAELTQKVKALSQQEGTTLFMTLLAAFQTLLWRYSGQDQIVVGTPIANRTRSEVEELIGFFVNTLALRSDLSGDPSFVELLGRVREVALGAYAHQDLPFEKLVEELQPERSLSHSPIFQVMFMLQHPPQTERTVEGLRVEAIDSEGFTAKFDLSLALWESGGKLSVWLEYNTDLFDAERIERLLGHFRTLLQGIVADPDRAVSNLPLLTEPECEQLLAAWNDTSAPYPRERCLHQLVEAQVQRTPDAPAVVFADQQLSYAELNTRANQLAHYLQQQGVGPEVLVGLCVERSIEMVVGILGILKAGGAYVPLDPSYPPERLQFMLEDARTAMLLTQKQWLPMLPDNGADRLCLDGEWDRIGSEPATAPVVDVSVEHPAYVIYTSGSTGRPKGVVVTHRGLANVAANQQRTLGVGSGERIVQFASMSFDACVFDLVMALCSGSTLYLGSREALLPGAPLTQFLRRHAITAATLPPTALGPMRSEEVPSLRLLSVAGEACAPELAARWSSGRRFFNLYGPTEATIWATYQEVSSASGSVTIGRPIGNTRVYVLDGRGQPVPVGVAGELYLGGMDLARGYLNRADLTAEKFVPDPFLWESGSRLYRTGDLVRYLADGNLEFLGRIDQQVKVRGFRIELGEIESALLAHSAVRDALVVVREDDPGEKRLVAYVLGESVPDTRALREYLEDKLPGYMVPVAFVTLEEWPLSPSGKVDRKALPAPSGHGLEESYVAPRTPIEEGVAEIWGEVLHVDRVGVHDMFFELGGHSLLATQVISRIRSTFQVELPLHALFEAPTIAGLAVRIGEARGAGAVAAPPLTRVSRAGALPLSFAQQRLWFIDRLEPESTFYNVSLAMRLNGTLDQSALERSLTEILRRHEVLRTSFPEVEGVPAQVVQQATPVRFDPVDLSLLSSKQREDEVRRLVAEEARRPFNLIQGPLFRTSLLRLSVEEHILLMSMHHIVADGWSHGVLTRELRRLYNAFCADMPSPLAELSVQYVDYAAWQREWMEGEALDGQMSYWKEHLAGAPSLLELPTDRPRPLVETFRGSTQHVTLPLGLLRSLKELGRREGTTLFMTLMAAFQVLLYRYSGQEDMVVATPIANRTHAEIEEMIGFFVNTLALRGDLSGNPTFQELLGRVRAAALGAYAHQDLPFEKLVEELSPERSLSHSPIFQVMLILQNAPEEDLDLDRLRPEYLIAEWTTAKRDLSLTLCETTEGLSTLVEYNTDLFDADRMERLLGHFQTLLEGIVADPQQRVSQLPLLTPAERRQLADFNATPRDYDLEGGIHQLIEEQVLRTPEALALHFEDEQLTYSQLNARANRLAHFLREQGVGPDVLVGLHLNRSIEMVVGILAVLKAGGAYVPFDPSYPPERLAFMLDDAQVSLLFTQASLQGSLPPTSVSALPIEAAEAAALSQPEENPVSAVSAEHLAYMIYTSGSTGQPKGALNTHRAIRNRLLWMQEEYGLDSSDRVLQKTPFSFDVSVWEFLWPLLSGACLVVARPEGHKDPVYLVELIRSSGITTLHFVPSMLRVFLEVSEGVESCVSLRRVICSGEALPLDLTQRFFSRLGGVALHNLYGPTEAAVDVTYYACSAEEPGSSIPIGRPIANTQIHILDRFGGLVPAGVPGELYIGGVNVGRGYHNRPELSAEKFVVDPFVGDGVSRMYRTGDLCRYLPDGNIEYLGRLDYQVKIRGFRIELGEIESVLLGHGAVRDAVVVAREDVPGDKRLAAYVVADREALTELEELRDTEAAQTSQWQAVFDARFGEPNPEEDVLFNTQGWISSYTDLPIPSHEMHEWVDQTVASILALRPRRLVEIGCGTGLLLFQIAPHCDEVIATDFSAEALRYVERALAQTQIPASRVKLQQKMADEFADFGSEAPDTVVLNSVVQYFPSIDYLLQVLDKAVAALAKGGRIFLGDLRSLTLLEEFQSAVELCHAADATDRQRMRQRIQQAVAEEDELLIEPAFFLALRERLPQIGRVDVELKRGRYWNEMNQFRYDVVLHVGPEQAQPQEVLWQDWQTEGMSLASLELLLQRNPDFVALTSVPNARVAEALQAWDLIAREQGAQTAAAIRAAVEAQRRPAVDPEEMWELGASHGYTVRICPSGRWHRGCMDVLLCSPSCGAAANAAFPGHAIKALTSYGNDPVRGKLVATFVPQLRRYVLERLPEYMAPSSMTLLDALPLTPNGKVDRKALPSPDLARPDVDEDYEAPQTQVERDLAAVWAEVLRLDRVGRRHNFFELGGHSLLATQVIARIRKTFEVELPLRAMFEAPTVAELGIRIMEAKGDTASGAPPLVRALRQGPVPLSFAQQRLWFIHQLAPESPAYNIPRTLELLGPLNVAALEQSLQAIVRRHEALRTTFVIIDAEPVQVIGDSVGSLDVVDLCGLAQRERESEAQRRIAEELRRPFDLAEGPLFRTSLLKLGEEAHILLLTMHHIVSDGWSEGVLRRELEILYKAYSAGKPSPLAELPIQYADYAVWQRERLQGETLQRQISYWKERLGGAPTLLELPMDRARPTVQTFRGTTQSVLLCADLTREIQALAQQEGSTLFMTLLAAFQTLLFRYSGQEDFVVGTPIANRTQSEVEGLIGFFVNALALRADMSGDPSFVALLERVREVCLGAYAHQDLPFEKLVDELRPERSQSHSPLFQVLFTVHNAPGGAMALEGVKVSLVGAEAIISKFDMSFNVIPIGSALRLSVEYNTDLFDAPRMQRLLAHYQRLLEGIVSDPQARISRLPILTDAERQELLVDWNATSADYPGDRCFHEMFEEQAERTPDAVAVVFEEGALTYRQLNARANQLAHYLRRLGVGPEVLVGLAVDRSLEMVVGILGTLKAGGAYVPLDPSYPLDRLAYMLEDAKPSVLLSRASCVDALPSCLLPVLCLDTEWPLIATQSEANLRAGLSSDNAAYVIYTSGTAGRPKGAVIRQGGLTNYLSWCSQAYNVADGAGSPVHSSLSFDLTVTSLMPALLVGRTAWLVQEGDGVEGLAHALRGAHDLSLVKITPAHLELLSRELTREEARGQTRALVIGGEALRGESLTYWRENAPRTRIVNEYGPTETVVGCCVYSCTAGECGPGSVPIGRPIANTRLYVLDRRGHPVPVGVAGELYIGGDGVGRGYLQRAELTAERFVPDPFSSVPGLRLYRTGDLVRYLADGNIEYLGRLDSQVKIRGFRIELGEIQSVLLSHPGVRDAVVLAREDVPGEKRLVAYVVADREAAPGVSELREHLLQTLPEYMLPSAFVMLETLPLTPNGKVDRKALPAPDTARPDLAMGYTAPSNAVQEALAHIWCEVLRLQQVGIHDNFFELGGDSILSIQIIARANAAGLRLTPRQVFQHQTIAGLASVAGTHAPLQSEQGAVSGPVALTPIQHWFFEQERVEAHHFNQANLLQMQRRVAPQIVARAAWALLCHHDALRLRFVGTPQGWQQSNAVEETREYFSVVDLSGVSREDQSAAITAECARLQASLNLWEGPLLRVCYLELGDEEPARLLLVMHHLSVDGVSWRVLLEDLTTGIEQLEHGEGVSLPAKTSSFQAWSHRLSEYAGSSALLNELGYWQEVSSRRVAPLRVDYVGGANTVSSERVVRASLDAEATQALLSEVPSVYHTQINDALLTALARSVCGWTGAGGVVVDLEGHGREALFEELDLSRTVGWFTSVYPVLLEWASSRDWGECLKGVKERLRGVPNRGIGYGVLRYLSPASEVGESLSGGAGAQISFNYHGHFDSAAGGSGLLGAAQEWAGPIQSPRARRTHLLEVIGQVTGGRLQMAFFYSEEVHARSTVEGLAHSYLQSLRDLISHCQSPDAGGYTPSDFPRAKLSQQALDHLVQMARLTTEDRIEDIYALSPMQAGMLFHSLYATEHAVYVDQQLYQFHGDLNPHAFEQAWRYLALRYTALRTSIHWQGLEEPLQVVHARAGLALEVLDWSGLSAQLQETERQNLLTEDRARGVDLSRAPLMRLTLLHLGTNRWQLLWTVHHLLLDRWSIAQILADLRETYAALNAGRPNALGAARPYGDYIEWLAVQDASAAQSYWRRVLGGFTRPTRLPIARRGAGVGSAELPSTHQVALSEATSAALHALSREYHLTLNTVLLGAWALLLSRYSGEEAVLFGATVSGRPASLSGVESMVGLFINSLPVAARVEGSSSVVEWLAKLQESQLELREYEYSSLVEIQGWSDVAHGVGLFESLVVVQNTPRGSSSEGRGVEGEGAGGVALDLVSSSSSVDFPLILLALPAARVLFTVSYDASMYSGSDIARLARHLETVLEGMAAAPEGRLGSVSLLSAPERDELLVDWNATSAEYDRDRCIHELFEEQAERTPDTVALAFGDERLSYRELNERANRLAAALREQGVSAGVLVGLLVERSAEMIVGLLGILKAGGAYVPIDPDYPPDRIRHMLADSRASVLLTRRDLNAVVSDYSGHTMFLNEAMTMGPIGPIGPISPMGPAYVIYTSGSTGLPKGVVVTHRNLVHSTTARRNVYDEAPAKFLLLSSFAFDSSVAGIFWTLCEGGCLVLPTRSVQEDLQGVLDLMASEGVSHYLCVPSLHRVFLQEIGSRSLDGLRTVIVAGEECSSGLVAQHFARLPQTSLYNEYGPTEATVWASVWRASAEAIPGVIPIGRPIANTQLYVLDARLRPVPVGVPGELYVGGAGLAEGYLGRAALTAERFVANPLSTEAGGRLYRTGDLVRYLSDGNLEYLGRVDNQVKIRGFRIELGEIEQVLLLHPEVREAVVAAQEDALGDKQLVAYVVGRIGALNLGALREHLRRRLPAYMEPSSFVSLESLPLSPNGKVDRKALPMADAGGRTQRAGEFVAPRTPIEEGIAEIWREVLHQEQVGIHDNFFDLGGHSLLATQVLSRLRKTFEVELPMQALFEAPTIAEQAQRIVTARGEGRSVLPPLMRGAQSGPLPLSFAQQRLWFAHQLDPNNPAYNVACMLKIEGSLSVPTLQRALKGVVERHAILRTAYVQEDGVPMQVVSDAVEAPFTVVDLSGLDEADRQPEAFRLASEQRSAPFDLGQGPLLQSVLYSLNPTDHLLVLTMHHIVSDGWSVALIVRELTALYTAYLQGEASPLPELPVQYTDYAIWQRRLQETEAMQAQLAYWQRQLADAPQTTSLPMDRPRPARPSLRGAAMTLEIDVDLAEGLRAVSRREGATLYMVLLACFNALLHCVTDAEDVVVGTDCAGRNQTELEGLVGFFINNLVLRTDLSGNPSLRELVARVRHMALQAYSHQDIPFDRLVEVLQPGRDPSYTPMFQMLVVMQNGLEPRAEGTGMSIKLANIESCTSKFDLALFFGESEYAGRRHLFGHWEYSTDLFDAVTIRRMSERFETVVSRMVTAPETRLTELKVAIVAADVSRRRREQERRDAANYTRFQRSRAPQQSVLNSSLSETSSLNSSLEERR